MSFVKKCLKGFVRLNVWVNLCEQSKDIMSRLNEQLSIIDNIFMKLVDVKNV